MGGGAEPTRRCGFGCLRGRLVGGGAGFVFAAAVRSVGGATAAAEAAGTSCAAGGSTSSPSDSLRTTLLRFFFAGGFLGVSVPRSGSEGDLSPSERASPADESSSPASPANPPRNPPKASRRTCRRRRYQALCSGRILAEKRGTHLDVSLRSTRVLGLALWGFGGALTRLLPLLRRFLDRRRRRFRRRGLLRGRKAINWAQSPGDTGSAHHEGGPLILYSGPCRLPLCVCARPLFVLVEVAAHVFERERVERVCGASAVEYALKGAGGEPRRSRGAHERVLALASEQR